MEKRRPPAASFPDDTPEQALARYAELYGAPQPEALPPVNQMQSIMDLGAQAGSAGLNAGVNPLQQQLFDKYRESIGLQQEGIDALKSYRDKLPEGPGGVDLSPLLALADSWANQRSNLIGAYTKPETAKQREAERARLTQSIINAQGGVSESELGLLRERLKDQREREKDKEGKAGKQLSENTVLKVNEGNAIPEILQDVEKTIENNKGLFGLSAYYQGSGLGRITGARDYEDVKTIDSQMRASSQAFGKFMEGGVLRKEDEDKYRKMFPNTTDTPQVAKNKLSIVQRLLIQKQKSNLDALKNQGFDVTGLEKDFELKSSPTLKGPEVGTIQQGYRFKGGNPSDPKSWEKL